MLIVKQNEYKIYGENLTYANAEYRNSNPNSERSNHTSKELYNELIFLSQELK
jgi:hypothetical protein